MKYELTVILDSEAKKNAQTLASIEKEINAAKGTKVQKEDWGLKHFAYPIKKKDSGHYYFYTFETAPSRIRKLGQTLRLMGEVVRYLLVVSTK